MLEHPIEIDGGEKKIISILEKKKIAYITTGHAIGDLRYKGTVIERKEINDLFGNIVLTRHGGHYMSNHLKNQVADMANHCHSILVISGDIKDLHWSNIKKVAIWEYIIADIMQQGVQVWRVEDDEDLVNFALKLFKKAKKQVEEHRIIQRRRDSVAGIVHAASPRISVKARENLLEAFGCPLGIANATRKELENVAEIGPTIAKNIFNNFRSKK